MNITIEASTALAYVERHKDAHLTEYGFQMDGWRRAFGAYLTALEAWSLETGADRPPEPVRPVEPQSFESEYNDLIEILAAQLLSSDELVTLDRDDQRKIILDRFGWREVFFANSARYVDGDA